jgi:hypothetical protein
MNDENEVYESFRPFERVHFDDVYFKTAHMPPHSVEKFFLGTCDCTMCMAKVGIERGLDKKRGPDENEVRAKLRKRFALPTPRQE